MQTGRRGSARRGSRLVAEINVTPFVDVMLVLLVIFMITAPLLTSTVQVDLPQTQAARATGQDEPLVVTVNSSGAVYLMDSELDLETLIARLRAITNNNNDARIFVRGDKAINYGRVLEVMGAISAAGFSKVALVAEVPAGGTRPGQQAPRR
ncbi:MAG: protein TolR [Rhodospirillales bacterium]|nr:protein TolR [Rhodospirillales bacterium]